MVRVPRGGSAAPFLLLLSHSLEDRESKAALLGCACVVAMLEKAMVKGGKRRAGFSAGGKEGSPPRGPRSLPLLLLAAPASLSLRNMVDDR